MATTRNAGSLFLAAASPRLLNATNAAVILTASAPIFHVNTSGTPDTSTIILSARLIALEGTVTFSAVGATLSSISGNNATLAYSDMSANVATVTATLLHRGYTFTSTVNISKLFDPAVTSGLNNAIAHAYKRSGTLPTDNPGAIVYDFTVPGITTTTLANSWSKTIPSGTSPLYVVAASASNVGTTDSIASTEWSSPVALAQNGVDGLSVATVFIYHRTATNVAPALPSASATYTFATGALSGLDNGWTTSVPDTSGGKYLWISTATAANTTTTDTLPSTEWAAANLMAQDGVAGGNNAIVYAYQRSASAPALTPGAVTYDFTTATITTSALANGWLKTLPSGTDPLYVTTASASNSASTDSIGSGEWSGAVKLAENGSNGLDGLSVATVFIYKRSSSSTAPALPTASTTYTFATQTLTGLDGGWATSVPAASGNPYLWVSTATAANTTATDTLAASEWAAAQLMAQDGVATGGTRGAGHYYATGSSWTDAAADAATPGANIVDDVVTISNGSTFVSEKVWTGTAWVDNGVVINGNLIVPGSVTASKINSNGLDVRKTDGTVILSAGGLQAGFEAPGTLNSDIVLGGRNLYKRTTSLFDGGGPTSGSSISSQTSSGFTLNGVFTNDGCVRMDSVFPADGQYTVAFDVRVGSVGGFPLVLDFIDGGTWTVNPTTTVQHFSHTVTISGQSSTYDFIDFNGLSDQDYYFTNFMLVSGNKEFSYSPAPEDVAADTALAQSAADAAQIAADDAQADADAANSAINNSTTGLSSRLRNNADNVLGGILSADVVSAPTGFRAGTLTWDASGTRTGGYGVAITPKGLVGYTSAGALTFAIDATTGAATFAGALSAATGSFAGSLSAATGSFAGSLSAATGTFSGALSGATGTFSGALSAASGSFTGSLSGASGSFSGTLTASEVITTDNLGLNSATTTDIFSSGISSLIFDPSVFVVSRAAKVLVIAKFSADGSGFYVTNMAGDTVYQTVVGNNGENGILAFTIDAGTYKLLHYSGSTSFAYVLKVMA